MTTNRFTKKTNVKGFDQFIIFRDITVRKPTCSKEESSDEDILEDIL